MFKPSPIATAVLCAVAVSFVVTYPMHLTVTDARVIGHPLSDVADHIQGAWAAFESLRVGARPDVTTVTHFPAQLRLWFVDPVGAIMALPVWWMGPAPAWNFVLFLQVGLTAGAAFLAGRDLSGQTTGGVTSAVIVTASPYMLGVLHSGLSECVGMAPLVGAVWAVLRLTERDPRDRPPPNRIGPVTGLLCGLAAIQNPYYGVFAGLTLLVCLPGRDWRRKTRDAALASLWAIAVAAIPMVVLADALKSDIAAVHTGNGPAWNQHSLPAIDIYGWLKPGDALYPDTPRLGNSGILQAHYLGWASTLVLLLGVLRSRVRMLGMPLLVIALFSLGPILTIDRQPITIAGHNVPLPMALFYAFETPLRMLHHPYRIAALVSTLMAVAVAASAARFPMWIRWSLPVLILVENLTASAVPFPIATVSTAPHPIYRQLPDGPILDWPPDATTANRVYQMAQPSHGQAIPYGVGVFVQDELRGDPLIEQLLWGLDDVGKNGKNRDVPGPSLRPIETTSGDTALARLGFRSLVLHTAFLSEREQRKALRRVTSQLGPPTHEADGSVAWTLPTDP